MTIALSTPITGLAQTGFTAPTYTLVADTAPDVNGKQWAVSALGGTQAGVSVHSVASPFTITVTKPKVFRSLGKPNPVTGLVKEVPMNVYTVLTRKGVLPLANQPFAVAMAKTTVSVPAGSDTVDPEDIRAMLSCHFGALSQQSAGAGDTSVSGVI